MLILRRREFYEIIRKDPGLSVKLLWSFVQVLAERLRKTTADLSGARLEANALDMTDDVLFDEYMADELGTLQRVYDCAGIELTSRARAEIEAYRTDHPRGKEGRVVYDLRGDFATTPDVVRSRFRDYCDRFPVRIEVT